MPTQMSAAQREAGYDYVAGGNARMSGQPRDAAQPEHWLKGWDNVNQGYSSGAVVMTNAAAAKPADCPRKSEFCGGVMHTATMSSCILAGCKHNHNATHGGCGKDLRTELGWDIPFELKPV